MDALILKEEKQYLKHCVEVAKQNEQRFEDRKVIEKKQFDSVIEYLSTEFNHIDDEEKAEANTALDNASYNIDRLDLCISRAKKQQDCPYFASVNFKADDENEYRNYYIGIKNLLSEQEEYPLAIDWRAPISSIYYDVKMGAVNYEAPVGKISGDLSRKRQYIIKKGKLNMIADSSSSVVDEILIKILSENATSSMKNIVSTIQAEQNSIIREKFGKCMLVQGVAGSGKTSIALHRIAYLLYSNRETLQANNILIISPNKIFGSYISSVLPELGEENINQLTFDNYAKNELEPYVGELETREEMIEDVLNGNNLRQNSIQFKSSFEYFNNLKSFLNNYFSLEFFAKDIVLGDKKITKEKLEDLYYNIYSSLSPATRIEYIADYLVDELNIDADTNELAMRAKRLLYPMFSSCDIIDIFTKFLETQNLQFEKECGKIKNEDVASLLLIKNYLLGVTKRNGIKYLVIDEMQDFTPVHFALFDEIFDANKFYLGDIYQTIEKQLDKKYLDLLCKMLDADLINLTTCYRATKQISQHLCKVKKINISPVAREGEKVEIKYVKNPNNLIKIISKEIETIKNYNRIAIITETQSMANKIFKNLEKNNKYNLINSKNQSENKINIIPLIYSKGIEFDAVIYIKNNSKNCDNLDYIACSRALHKLIIINN